jgi:hypothetical protein
MSINSFVCSKKKVLKHCAANRKKRLSEFPNVGLYIYIYIYMTLKFVYLKGAPYIYTLVG